MREIKLKIDKKYDVKKLLMEYCSKKNISEFYERNIKTENKTITVFVFEDVYKKTVWNPKGKNIINTDNYYVTATTTMIVSEKIESTAVVLIYPSDDKNDVFNSIDLMLKDYGFRYI